MAQDDISAKLGLDTRPFTRALNGISGIISDFKNRTMNTFANIRTGILGAFTVGAITGGLKSLMDFADDLSDKATSLGVTTDYLQGLQHAAEQGGTGVQKMEHSLERLVVRIGEARDGSKDAIDMFNRYRISLSNADGTFRSTEEIMADVADRIRDLPDPTTRAAAAVEFFGKSGVPMVNMLQDGADALERFVNAAHKLSPDELQQIGKLGDATDAWLRRFKVEAGTVVSFFVEKLGGLKNVMDATFIFPSFIRRMFGGNAPTPAPAKRKAGAAFVLNVSKEEIAKTQEKLAEAGEELLKADEALRIKRLGPEQKLVALLEKRAKLEEEINLKVKDTEQNRKHKTNAAKEMLQVEQQIDSILKSQAESEERKRDAREEHDKRQRELDIAKEDRSKFTLQELASSPFRFTGRLAQEKRIAQQVIGLEDKAEALRLRGFTDRSIQLRNRADELRQGLSNVITSERFPFKAMEEAVKETAKQMTRFGAHISQDGLKVNLPMQ